MTNNFFYNVYSKSVSYKKLTAPFLVRDADPDTHIYTEVAKAETGLLVTTSATNSVLDDEPY
jgi:hypothetical protein